MSRIIMDTSSLATIMESAKPTGKQATNQTATKLLAAFNKVYDKAEYYKEIEKALDTFYAKRGLNLPCRMLDSFFSAGARKKARNYLNSLEVIALLDQVNNQHIETIKPLVHQYMQEKDLLERSDATLNEELKQDCQHNVPPQQSPYLTGHILSRLCRLSDKPSAMLDTWDISEFNILGDYAWATQDTVHLPVQGVVTFHDDDLPFARYQFQFEISNLENNDFSQEFILSQKPGDASQLAIETLKNINSTKQSLSTLIQNINDQYVPLLNQTDDLLQKNDELIDLLVYYNGKNDIYLKLDDFRESALEASRKVSEIKNMYATCSEKAKEFSSYNAHFTNDLANKSATISFEDRGVLKLFYEGIEDNLVYYHPESWTNQTPRYTWIEATEKMYTYYNDVFNKVSAELLDKWEVYHKELNIYSDMVKRYCIYNDCIVQKEIALDTASKLIDSNENDEAAVIEYVRHSIGIYNNIAEMNRNKEIVKNNRAYVFELRQNLQNIRYVNLHTTEPIPEDNFVAINHYMREQVKSFGPRLRRILDRGIVNQKFLSDCAEMTGSNQISQMILNASKGYLQRMAQLKNQQSDRR